MSEAKDRSQVKKSDCWCVESLYPDWQAWKEDFSCLANEGAEVRWPQFARNGLNLADPSQVKRVLDDFVKVSSALDRLYTYAHLRHDEDVAEQVAKEAYTASVSLFCAFQEETSWIDPALLQLSQEQLDLLLEDEKLKEYRIFLKKIIRLKPYTLDADKEMLLASVEKALQTAQKTFGALNNADLQFKKCTDEKGVEHSLSHGTYQLYLRSQDRQLRKQAYYHLHEAFLGHENTLCELLQGLVERHVFYQKARGYESCLQAALYPHSIDTSVYRVLVDAVREEVSALHEYVALRKKCMGYAELHPYDLSVPLVKEVDRHFTYEEAVSALLASVSPLGEEYQKVLSKGLLEERWVDRYENKRKRSGAYSSGCYTSRPFILMNFQGTLQDVMTLTHEAGHSMHSYYSCKEQRYQDHQYPIFLAEVASTFHEELLFRHLLAKAKSKEEKAYLINQKIDDIRSTLFRQTLFAEFELMLHEWGQRQRPFTPELLKGEYLKLVEEYSGHDLTVDPILASEWSRIPHFYYNFYVYQYATGVSAAHVLVENLFKDPEKGRERYLHFLSLGGSKEPILALQEAGVDMTRSDAIKRLLQAFRGWVRELGELLNE